MDLRGTGFSRGCIDYLGPRRRRRPQARHRVARPAAVVERPRRRDRRLVRRLDADPRRRAASGGAEDDRADRRLAADLRRAVPGRRAVLRAVGEQDYGVDDAPALVRQPRAAAEQRQEARCTGAPRRPRRARTCCPGATRRGTPRATRARRPQRPDPGLRRARRQRPVGAGELAASGSTAGATRATRSCSATGATGRRRAATSGSTRCIAWFDRHLAQRDVETGPRAEVFLTDGTFDEACDGDRDEMLTGRRWPLGRRR